jgi:hypothetical protein
MALGVSQSGDSAQVRERAPLEFAAKLFLASFLALYFELLIIRYISTELQLFMSLKNLPLIASLFGIGIGMLRGDAMRGIRPAFVFVALTLFLLARFGVYLPQPSLSWEYSVDLGHPTAEPNRSVRDYYELPYRFVSTPGDVLVVGAGTGNDVAAALRHDAQHVDAVEIDPTILGLGRQFHPEHPYDSSRVSQHVDDARAAQARMTSKMIARQ